MQTYLALQKYFARKQKASKGFSMRALARKLDVSPSFLSRIMNGKKPVPEDLLGKLAKALDVEPEMITADPATRALKREFSTAKAEEFEIVPQNAEQILRNWFYLAVLEVTTLKDYDGTPAQIAHKLGLAEPAVDVALRELESFGLLARKNGLPVKAKDKMRFASATGSKFIRKFHDEMMEQAQMILRKPVSDEDFQKRLMTGVTLSATPEAVQVAKRKLAKCLYEIANELMSEPGSEVYHLAMQLFPLTKC